MSVNLKAQYAQCRLTTGDLKPNYKMANATSIAAAVMGLYLNMSNLAITQGGAAAIAFFKQYLSVVVNIATGAVTILQKAPFVGQVRELSGTIEISFQNFGT